MKVLYIDHSPEVGGATRVLLNLIATMKEAGSDVEPVFIFPAGSLSASDVRCETGAEVIELDMPWFTKKAGPFKLLSYLLALLRASSQIKKIIRREGVDIVHANTFIAALYSILPRLKSRIPLLWHMHDILEFTPVNKFFIRLPGRFADRIVCPSGAVKSSLMEFGVKGDKCAVIYNSTRELKEASTSEAIRSNFRDEFSITRNAPLVGLVAVITRWKGHDLFIKAAQLIGKELPEACFVVVGDAMHPTDVEFKSEVLALVRELGMEDQVIFTGRRADVTEIMKELDVVVHGSVEPDPFPTVILEAMSTARPVVAARSGGCSEMIEQGVNGLLYTPGDAGELATSVLKILRDRELAKAMGESGALILERKFSRQKNLKSILEEYASITNI